MKKNIIVVLDYSETTPMFQLVDKLDPAQCRLKVGKELFTRFGPSIVKELMNKGFDIFLDLKFHDIPNTVANACRAAADLGVWMLNVHALGGKTMLEAAVAALAPYDDKKPLLIAVTILTSLSDADLAQIGIQQTTSQQVLLLAQLAQQAGLDGVVCSAQEAALLKVRLGTNFLTVTPGIRLDANSKDDQQRTMTPGQAVASGADYLVIGRPITQAVDPSAVLRQIAMDMNLHAMP